MVSQTILSTPEEKPNRCCTWPVLVITAILLAGAGVLIWQFAPINEAIQVVVDGFGDSSAPTPVPNPNSPPPTPISAFQFNQCTTTDDCCNGLDTICDLKVNEVLFAGTHNSYASQDKGFIAFSGNHIKKLEDQLDAGYRAINIDMCGCGGNLVVCHNFCDVSRDTDEVFGAMTSFLDANPTEILLVQLELNPDLDQPADLDEVYTAMQGIDGFVDYLYIHPDSSADWPTLRELKDAGKRMLVFHTRGPSCTDASPCPDGLHNWFEYGFETPFQFTNVLDIESDYAASCSADRGANNQKKFFGINHFTRIPIQNRAEDLGTVESLETRIDECSSRNNDQPVNVVLIDFWTTGNLLQVVQEHNGELGRRRAV